MENKDYDKIAENLLMFFPLFRGALIKIAEKEKSMNIFNMQYAIMGTLYKKGSLPVSEIGKLLGISKPNMTALTDKLITEKRVKRMADPNDRRVVRIDLTEKGKQTLHKAKAMVKEEFREKLSGLEKSEVEQLSKDLESVKKIISKITQVNKGGGKT